MTTIHTLVLIAHVLVSAMIIALVLLQRGKGAEAGAAFGAGASGTVFGAKGSANFLSRSTAALATLFFASSLGLAYLGAQRPVATSIVEETEIEAATSELLPAGEELPQPGDDLPALPEAIERPALPDLPDEAPEQ
jgi:preprotein translocase subunit SecG